MLSRANLILSLLALGSVRSAAEKCMLTPGSNKSPGRARVGCVSNPKAKAVSHRLLTKSYRLLTKSYLPGTLCVACSESRSKQKRKHRVRRVPVKFSSGGDGTKLRPGRSPPLLFIEYIQQHAAVRSSTDTDGHQTLETPTARYPGNCCVRAILILLSEVPSISDAT